MQFIHPALAFGALLFAVPLIIHLLNRQRFRRRDWAAMEFLLRAFRKQRRRLRAENLILLLLRCLIPIVLALALARPFAAGDAAAVLPGASGTVHHVLVFDQSYSMGFEPSGSESPHQRSLRLAQALLKQLGDQPGQKVTLVQSGVRPKIPLREDQNLNRVRSRLAGMENPQDAASTLGPALLQVAEMLEENRERPQGGADASVRVHIFTDLQHGCFGKLEGRPGTNPQDAGDAEPAAATNAAIDNPRELIDRLQKLAAVTVFDTADRDGAAEDNVQISDLRLGSAQAQLQVAANIIATVRNLSRTARIIAVSLETDGGEPIRQSIRLEAGDSGEVPFPKIFRGASGPRRLTAAIDADGLLADNERHLIVQVRQRVSVLLVEGSDEAEPALQDSYWLRQILDPTQGKGPPQVTEFAPTTIDSLKLLTGGQDLRPFDVIFLCNVARLNETAANAIKDAVRGGAGLMIMIGDRCDPISYNLHLFDSGDGPLPLRLNVAEGYEPGQSNYFGSQIVAPQHPALTDFLDPSYARDLEVTPIYRFIGSDRDSLTKSSQVLVQVRNAALSPLLVAGNFGHGRTLLLTSAINKRDGRWNRLENRITSFLLFFPAAHWLSQPAIDPFNVLVGAALTTNIRGKPSNMAVVPPQRAGRQKTPVGQEAQAMPGKTYALPPFTQTEHAGVYGYEMDLADSNQPTTTWFAVNPEPDEGRLAYHARAAVAERLGIKNVLTSLPRQAKEAIQANQTELGPFFLYLTLFFLIGEAAMARYVARRRR